MTRAWLLYVARGIGRLALAGAVLAGAYQAGIIRGERTR